ncbi:OMP1 protein [Synechococcus phage ACG-2014d]|uniref:OMP1 protein n=1 Tax=Synechococcus phage ACG-2014d TaxID=1493509 RepID=A0A0E3FEQ6_9CAUD|nr:OMP1 protein [Synechococcus phage ACG-2014d]AIX27071.1 OMP1 protein [Synechococcus phage ACG-2014d]
MKKLIPVVMILISASAAQAGGLVSSQSSSVQLTVDAARSTAVRVGNSYSISGTNVGTSDGTTAGVLSTGTITSGVYSPGTISANQLSATNGESFSYSTSFTQGDAIPTAAPTVGDVPNFSNVTSYTAGSAGSLAGTVLSTGALTVTAGGAGTTATGQFVSEITVID